MSSRLDIWPLTRALSPSEWGLSTCLVFQQCYLDKSGHSQSLILQLLKKDGYEGQQQLEATHQSSHPGHSLPSAVACLKTNHQISSNRPYSHKGSLTTTASTPKPSENPDSSIPCGPLLKAFCFFVFAPSNCLKGVQESSMGASSTGARVSWEGQIRVAEAGASSTTQVPHWSIFIHFIL